MNAALLILAAVCFALSALLLHVAIRCNKLIDENRSFKETIRTLSTENESLTEANGGLREKCHRLVEQNGGFEKQIAEADKKLIALPQEYEAKIAELKQREANCPFRREDRNRITYCMKEKEKK